MLELANIFQSVSDFMQRGGDVLILIFIVIFVMWTLVLERVVYFRTSHKTQARQVLAAWEGRKERTSWYAHQVRAGMLSDVRENLMQNIDLIKTMVAICPLCGLLGTVTGMIEVFDVMALLGNGNARAMASGVSKATIPTMAGMVGALSGVFAATYIERQALKFSSELEDDLTMDH